MIDQTISHFRITEKLGAGGMGVVYKAFDTRLERPVALKFLSDNLTRDPLALERFRREARAASALNHPGICTIYDVGEQDGRAFIAMEFIDGETLRSRIHGTSLSLAQTLHFAIQIAEALDAAHSQGIIHRDIKPANIFVTRRGQTKVLDFGLAKLVAKELVGAGAASGEDSNPSSVAGIISGTPAYMSPEQVRGDDLDTRTDIFSLGLILYEMATGRQAFGARTPGMVIEAVLTRSPAPPRTINSEIPSQLEEIITRALRNDREERYQHAADLRDDLQRLERNSDSGSAWLPSRDPTVSGFQETLHTTSAPLQPARHADTQSALTPAGQTSTVRAKRPSRKPIDSLAVLPFENLSRDAEYEYLSDGITGSLINVLATVPKLRVMAQSTVFRYKGRSADPQIVGSELNVRAVLTGRIVQSGGSLRIGAELVDAATGLQLWGAQYNRASGDIFAIQDEISQEISEKLRLKLTNADQRRLTRRQTRDPEAYRLYLKGRHHWDRWTEDGFYKAIELFQQAIDIDPAYALAYSGIADSYVLLGWNSYLPPKDAFPKAKAAAAKALQIDPNLGEARAPLAAVHWLYDWQWSEAQAEFERSIALNPAYPTSNHWHAEYLMTMGRHPEAIACMKKSQELDPLSLIIGDAIGWAFYMARSHDQSMDQLRRTIELDPHYPVTYWILGLLLRSIGRFSEAVAAGEKAVALSGGSPIMRAALAQTLAVAGQQAQASQILQELLELSKQKYVSPYFFLGIYLGLGQHDRAIECLEQAFTDRSHWLLYLHLDPAMDALRPDPRFQQILRSVGLPLPSASS
jgi:serine/threonine-protein kinase